MASGLCFFRDNWTFQLIQKVDYHASFEIQPSRVFAKSLPELARRLFIIYHVYYKNEGEDEGSLWDAKVWLHGQFISEPAHRMGIRLVVNEWEVSLLTFGISDDLGKGLHPDMHGTLKSSNFVPALSLLGGVAARSCRIHKNYGKLVIQDQIPDFDKRR